MLRSVPPGKTSKVIVCGYEGCGKTSIIEQLIYGNLHLEKPIHPTIEDVYCAIIDNDRGGKEKICFYDTAGMKPSHCEVPRAYLTAADGFVLVYAINNKESFKLLDQIKKDIVRNKEKKDVPIIVLGNKVDKQRDRQVDVDKAKNWALREKGKSGFPQLGRKGRSSSVTMEL